MTVRPFEVAISDDTLADLRARLDATQLPHDGARADWDAGTSPAYLRRLLEHWRTEYDWREREDELRALSHFRADLGGTTVHFVHEPGRGPAPLPLVLTHGFPDSFLRFLKLIPLLTDPGAHGGDPEDAFHVVVPSLPGHGFSDPPGPGADIFHVADRWHELMTALGYARYGAHGGDWGGTVTEHLGRSHASSVVGIHLTDVPYWHAFRKPRRLSPDEEKFFAAHERFQRTEAAYAMIQGTRPQTLADALNDSPVGLAAWIVDFYQRWSDGGGDLERRFTMDELLDGIMVTWATGSIGTSFLPYFEMVHAGAARWIVEKAKEWIGSSRVPAGFALFPRDLTSPPREWAERFFAVEHWTVMPRGGHFAAMEEPELLAEDLRAFFRPLRRR